MMKPLLIRILLAAGLAFPLAVHGQDYPSKMIKIIVGMAPGVTFETVTRIIAEKLRDKWSQPVIVDNRPGASSNIAAELVSRAAPDGYTLMFATQSVLAVNKSLFAKLTYDPDAFVPVSVVLSTYNVLLVNPKVPAVSVQQLIDYAKANPDRRNYSSGGNGSSTNLAGELFKTMAGVKIVHVPYKGGGASIMALMSGEVHSSFVDIAMALPLIRSGKVRVLAVASEKRSSVLPDIPAMSEVLPGFLSVLWMGAVAPAGTPSAIANQLSGAIAEILKQPDVAKRLLDMNFDPIGSTPKEMALFMAQERERWGKVVRDSGAKSD